MLDTVVFRLEPSTVRLERHMSDHLFRTFDSKVAQAMRIVCYIVNTVKLKVGHEPQPEDKLFFGTLEDVAKELQDAERDNRKAQIVHANDPETLADLKNLEGIIKQLTTHSLDELPKYPRSGKAEMQSRFEFCPHQAYINQVQVSIRGDKMPGEPEQKPRLNIILPPGVIL